MSYMVAKLGSDDIRPATDLEIASAAKCANWYSENGKVFTFIGMGRSLLKVFRS